MPDLQFTVESAEVAQYAAAPLLVFKVRVVNVSSDEVIHTVALRAQIQIEVSRRKYDANEQARLLDLFGEPDRWGQTLRSLLWTHASVVVPGFNGSALADIPVPCTFDFNVAATKYFHGVTSGDLPLCFQFSGTVFYVGEEGTLQVAPISWDKESKYRLPVKVWKDMMDAFYPNSAWLSLHRDTFEKLSQYKMREGIPTWEEALERALAALPGNGAVMKAALVDGIVKAVLYEGYMLYPYRPSSVKNQQRFNFGVVYPRAYSEAQGGTEAWTMQTQCLVQGGGEAQCIVRVRFLRMVARSIGKLQTPSNQLTTTEEQKIDSVERLEVAGQTLHPWQEAAEEVIEVAEFNLSALAARSMQWPFQFSARQESEAVRDESSLIVGIIQRDKHTVAGTIDLGAERVAPDLFKLTIHISNASRVDRVAPLNREQALSRALVSAHTILEARGGEFVSLIDPPQAYRDLVAGCQNVGTWPVLVGQAGERDTMLSSPIILYDYPEIAPESPGDLFDGAEIDEILSLRIMTMTDEEKREMRQSDDRTRKILERTESMPDEQFMKLHGALRGLRNAKQEMP